MFTQKEKRPAFTSSKHCFSRAKNGFREGIPPFGETIFFWASQTATACLMSSGVEASAKKALRDSACGISGGKNVEKQKVLAFWQAQAQGKNQVH